MTQIINRRAAALAVAGFAATLANAANAAQGDALMALVKSWGGAVPRTVHDAANDTSTIRDVLPAGFSLASDATAHVQAALDSGAKVVDFLGLGLRITSVNIPAGVWARGVDWTRHTVAAGRMVLVNSGVTVSGKLTGSGFVGGVEGGIYPAGAGVSDVVLHLETVGFTHAVHAAPVAAASSANNPKRWRGQIYTRDTVGTVGNSEGHGVMLESAQSCTLTVKATNIRRHAVYLSAGACWNVVDADVDQCGNYAVQLNAISPQAANSYNTVTVKARNLTTDVAGQSGALAVLGRSHRNTLSVDVEGNATTYEAVRFEGGSGGVQADHPLGNILTGAKIVGQFTGGDVVRMLNADGTVIRGNVIAAYATVSVIASRRTGTNLSLSGGYIESNVIDAQGQAIKGLYLEVNTAPTHAGPNSIGNNAGALRVDDQTGGQRTGRTRRAEFSGTTASVAAGGIVDTTVTLSQPLQTAGRIGDVRLESSSGSFFGAAFWSFITSAPSATQLTFRTYNGAAAGQTFTYAGWVEGD